MNSLTIAGNIGKDATLRRTQGGKDVASFSVAVSKGRDQETIWFDCSVWGERGAKLVQYLTKGTKVCVQGEVSAREHNGKAYLQVFVRELTLLGGGQQREDTADGYQPNPTAYGTGGRPTDDLDGDTIPFAAIWQV
jgi:single-strand DNA-binding protein